MLIINEIKFNRLWTISKYVYGLYPIITVILWCLIFPSLLSNHPLFSAGLIAFFSNNPLIAANLIASSLFGILILTRAPRLGAYLMAALSIISVLIEYSQFTRSQFKFELSNFIIIFAYIAFGLLTELKETAQQQ